MRSFAERLIGKSVVSIDRSAAADSILIVLSDRSSFTVYTEVLSRHTPAQEPIIEGVEIGDAALELHLAGGDLVEISTNRQRFSHVVEFFVYNDEDGYVVEN